MKKKILAVTVMSILVIAGIAGIAKAKKDPPSYDYTFLTPFETDTRVPRFSPNGKWIAYHGFGFFKKVVVQRIDDPSGSTMTTVFNTADYPTPYGDSLAGIPVWTQNGKSIYFWYGYTDEVAIWREFIYAVDIEIEENNVILGEPYEILDGGTETDWQVENFDISTTGKFLVFWRIEKKPGIVNRADLYLVPRKPDGTFNIEDKIQLTDTPDIAEYEPRFSPDGKEIVFFSGEGPAHSGNWVEVISLDSFGFPVEESRRVVKEDASWPFWSPDGKYLGITNENEISSGDYDIWVIDSDTGDFLWQVTNKSGQPGAKTSCGDWSPTDRNSIVFRMGYTGIYYADAQH